MATKVYAITELGCGATTMFDKLRNFYWYYFNDEIFMAMPDEVKEAWMKRENKTITRQTIARYTQKLVDKNLIERNTNFAKVLSGNFDQTITPAAGAGGTGRKEMVPKWMQRPSSVSAIGTTPGVINQGPDRQAMEDMERLRRYMDELKTAGNDPQVAARAEALKQSLAEGTNKKGRKETSDGNDEEN